MPLKSDGMGLFRSQGRKKPCFVMSIFSFLLHVLVFLTMWFPISPLPPLTPHMYTELSLLMFRRAHKKCISILMIFMATASNAFKSRKQTSASTL